MSLVDVKNVILTPKEGLVFPSNFLLRFRRNRYSGAYTEGDINVQCRGKMALCEKMMAKVKEYESQIGVDLFVGSYKNFVRRIYTVQEATEAVKGKGNNNFTIKYR